MYTQKILPTAKLIGISGSAAKREAQAANMSLRMNKTIDYKFETKGHISEDEFNEMINYFAPNLDFSITNINVAAQKKIKYSSALLLKFDETESKICGHILEYDFAGLIELKNKKLAKKILKHECAHLCTTIHNPKYSLAPSYLELSGSEIYNNLQIFRRFLYNDERITIPKESHKLLEIPLKTTLGRIIITKYILNRYFKRHPRPLNKEILTLRDWRRGLKDEQIAYNLTDDPKKIEDKYLFSKKIKLVENMLAKKIKQARAENKAKLKHKTNNF